MLAAPGCAVDDQSKLAWRKVRPPRCWQSRGSQSWSAPATSSSATLADCAPATMVASSTACEAQPDVLVRTMACPMVPLNPNDETPAALQFGASPGERQVASSWRGVAKAVPFAVACSTIGLTTDSLALGAAASNRCSSSARINPICPAGASVWPTFALAAPTTVPPLAGALAGAAPAVRKRFARAPASVGSPSGVPVPCASMRMSSDALSEDAASAAATRARCALPFGAVRLAERPSCRRASPLSTQPVHSSSPRQWEGARRTSAPMPSARA